jgi:hypothetical protein
MRYRFRDTPASWHCRDRKEHDPDGNPVEDASEPIAMFNHEHKPVQREDGSLEVHDADGRVASFRRGYRALVNDKGNIEIHPTSHQGTADGTNPLCRQLHALNQKHEEFYKRRS